MLLHAAHGRHAWLTAALLLPAAINTTNAGAAINQIVEDATQCKFESTNNAQDEIVLLNIVQVRMPCMCGMHVSKGSG